MFVSNAYAEWKMWGTDGKEVKVKFIENKTTNGLIKKR